jgi:hypothetical protein
MKITVVLCRVPIRGIPLRHSPAPTHSLRQTTGLLDVIQTGCYPRCIAAWEGLFEAET